MILWLELFVSVVCILIGYGLSETEKTLMASQPASVLHEENGVRFVELSSTFDGTFCAPPAVEHLDAAFSSKDVTLYRFNSEVGSARLTLSYEEMAALIEAWRSYCSLSGPKDGDGGRMHSAGGWTCPDCHMAAPVEHFASSPPSPFATHEDCPCSVCICGDASPLFSVPSSFPSSAAAADRVGQDAGPGAPSSCSDDGGCYGL